MYSPSSLSLSFGDGYSTAFFWSDPGNSSDALRAVCSSYIENGGNGMNSDWWSWHGTVLESMILY